MARLLKKKRSHAPQTVVVPTDEHVATLCHVLEDSLKLESTKRRYASVKRVLSMIGLAGAIGMMFVAPGTAAAGKLILDATREHEKNERKKYNPYYLRRAITRLHNQKLVDIQEENGVQRITLSTLGKRRIYKYALDDLTIPKQKSWDGRWRVIIYDVAEGKKNLRDVFRSNLQSLGFLKLQGSTWLYPYPCEDQVTFLREYYNVGNEVIYIVAIRLEDDAPYKDYFGLS